MLKKPSGKQYRILAIIWALAAAAMAVTVVRHLPRLNPLHLFLLALSLFVSASSWKAWKACRKAEEENRLKQAIQNMQDEQDIQDIQDQDDMEDESND